MAALTARKHPGRKPALAPRQKLQVRRWINGKDPRQYGFDFGLWTRQIVAALIAQKFGVRLGVTAVGRLLAELDITPQKPLRRAYERDPVAIERWTTTVFPRLRARAKRVGAKIFFLDEAGVRSDQVLGRHVGPAGADARGPHERPAPERERHLRRQRPRRLLVRDLHRAAQRPAVRRVADALHARAAGAPCSSSSTATPRTSPRWSRSTSSSSPGRLELHFLPGYAPELNPDEFVWNHLKRQGVSKTPLRRDESLRSRVQSDLAAIQSRPALVRSFFHAPSVAYTRD